MNVSRIQFGVAAVLILAGCGDRGQFQSRTYTEAEKVKFCKSIAEKRESQPQAVVDACNNFMKLNGRGEKAADTTLNPILDQVLPPTDPNLTPGSGQPAGAPAAPNKPADGKVDKDAKAPGTPAAKGAGEKAAAKNFFETPGDREAFIKSTLQVLELGDEGLATETVKGIDIPVENISGTLALAIDAGILFEGKVRYLSVPLEPIIFVKTGKIDPLTPSLKEFKGEDISGQLQDKVIINAACADEKCLNIHVRLQIAVEGKVANAVAIVSADQSGKYSISRNNFAAKPFVERMNEIFPKVDLSELKLAINKKDKLPTTIKGKKEEIEKAEADKAAAEKAAADKAAAEKAEADKLKAEKTPAEKKAEAEVKKDAPGAMKDTVGKTADAVKKAESRVNFTGEHDVAGSMANESAPATTAVAKAPATPAQDKYAMADQHPDVAPSASVAGKVGPKASASASAAPATTEAPKAPEFKRGKDEARLLESLKNDGVESHYAEVKQPESQSVAKNNDSADMGPMIAEVEAKKKAAGQKSGVEKASATDEDSSAWSKLNTFAESWLNF